ncbi:hypothetical protein [Streptosporangium sp. NPDC020145]
MITVRPYLPEDRAAVLALTPAWPRESRPGGTPAPWAPPYSAG